MGKNEDEQQQDVLDVVRKCQRSSFLQTQENLQYDYAIARQIEDGRGQQQALVASQEVTTTTSEAAQPFDVPAPGSRPTKRRPRQVLVDSSVISIGGNQEVLKALALHQRDQDYITTTTSIGDGNQTEDQQTLPATNSENQSTSPASSSSRESIELLPGAYSGEPGADLVRNEKARFSRIGRIYVPSSCTIKTQETMDTVPSSSSRPLLADNDLSSRQEEFGNDSGDDDEESAQQLAVARKVRPSENKTPHELPLAEEMDCCCCNNSVEESDHHQDDALLVQATRTFHWMGYAGCALASSICVLLGTGLILFILYFLRPDKVEFIRRKAPTTTDDIILDEQQPPNITTTFSPKEHLLHSLLPEYNIANHDDVLHTDETPQGKAFHWMIQDPNFSSYSTKRLRQRYALATIYYSTHGPRWNSWFWLDYDRHECDWNFFMPIGPQYDGLDVRYSKFKYIDGPCRSSKPTTTTTNASGTIIRGSEEENNEDYLYLAMFNQKGLRGWLPPQIAMLTSLRMIQLGGTNLEGTLPANILSQLTSLQELHLSGTAMRGSIPSDVGLLSRLELLEFGGNREINGHLPTQLGLLSNLHTLSILETNITGPLPVELGHLPNLKELQISGNAVTGSIPTQYGLLSNVDWFGIAENQLSGRIPSELGNLDSLWLAYLYDNRLSGSIPTQLGKFMGDIEQLYLSDNRLTGTIPTELAPPKNEIWRLRLHNNHLTGTVPSELGLLTLCSSLSFNQNMLTGTLPEEVGAIGPMEYFRVSDNLLSGTVPWQQFFEHPNMKHFWIGNNQQLSGTIPPGIRGWQNITELKIGNTGLSGALPTTEIGSLKELQVFEAASNPFLTGQVPEYFCSFKDDPGRTLAFDCGPLCGCHCACNGTKHP